MMKRKTFLIITIISGISAGLVLFLFWANKRTSSTGKTPLTVKLVSDTTAARYLYDQALKVKGKYPDSAVNLWLKCIKALRASKKNHSGNYLITSSYSQIARLYSDLSNYAEAKRYNDIAMKLALDHHDTEHIAYSTNVKGVLCFIKGDYDNALKFYEQALSMARKIRDFKFIGRIYTNKAIINYIRGNIPQAIDNFRQALDIARKTGYNELIAGSYINLGLTYFNTADYRNAEINYRKAIGIYQKTNVNDGGIGICYQNLGNIYSYTGDYKKAIESHELSMMHAQKVKDSLNVSRAHHNLGEIYMKLGDYNTSMKEYIRSIKIKESLNDLMGMGEDYTGLANLSSLHHNHKKALEYYRKSLAINERLNNIKGKAGNYSNIANLMETEKLRGRCIEYYRKSLQLYQQIGDKQGASDVLGNLGTVYKDQRNLPKASACFQNSAEQKKAISDKEGLVFCYTALSDLHLQIYRNQPHKKEDLIKAIDLARQAYILAEQIDALPKINEACLALKKAYKEAGNLAEALKYEEKHSEINDSIFSKAKTEAVVFAEARWDAGRKQETINNLRNRQKLNLEIIKRKELESRWQRTMLYTIIVAGVLLAFATILFFMYRRKKNEALYQKQLANITSLRMQNVRNRMSPHFFFNALSSVYNLTTKPEQLKQRFDELILLLRKTLENIENTAITLEEEIGIVRTFINIQKDRLPEPFHYEILTETSANLKVSVPAMIIQIPVENAIKHGLMPIDGPKELKVTIEGNEEFQLIRIDDNGIGLSASSGRSSGTGTGLKVLMQIIELLNSKNHEKITVSVKEKEEGPGTSVMIQIPNKYTFSV